MSTLPPYAVGSDGEPVLGPVGAHGAASGLPLVSGGEPVLEWRTFLIAAGYSAGFWSSWDNALTVATKAFQRDSGIEQDGLVGPTTRAAARARGFRTGGPISQGGALPVDAAPPPASPGSSSPLPTGGPPVPSTPTAAPFFSMPAWAGGPTRGQVAGAVGIGGGVILLVGALAKMLKPQPGQAQPGQANLDYRSACCE